MNAVHSSNNRLTAILIAILVVVLLALTLNVFLWFSMLGGGMMMGGGMMNQMMGMNPQTMNDMMSACATMMQNVQNP